MAEHSKIEWCDHTFNPWIGCTKISDACDHCYAEARDRRFNPRSGHWGPHAPRKRTSTANWRKPLKWDREAAEAGTRARVFCASLADVFDNHRSIGAEWRWDLWKLILDTPNLDWLLLTKRPQNIERLAPVTWRVDGFPPNVWIGTTVENQAEADRRIPHLLSIPARVRFLSCEPLLGPVDLTRVGNLASLRATFPSIIAEEERHMRPEPISGFQIDPLGEPYQSTAYYQTPNHMGGFSIGPRRWPRLDWIIAGGESGPGARPSNPAWFRDLRDQCAAADVPFHFKQWGEWAEVKPLPIQPDDLTAWPDGSFGVGNCNDNGGSGKTMRRIGKRRAGRTLDGVTHDGMPGEAQ